MAALVCPRCGAAPFHPLNALNALSRKDNQTYICSSCGSDEAMLNFRFGRDADVWPGHPGPYNPEPSDQHG